jgi:Fe-S cluster assembly iron-binding protein IscA
MLTLTPSAEEAVRLIVSNGPVDEDTGGLRIAPGEPTPDGVPLEITVVDVPQTGDQDAGGADAHVYLDPAAAEALDEMLLDAQLEDGRVGFALVEAPGGTNGDGG